MHVRTYNLQSTDKKHMEKQLEHSQENARKLEHKLASTIRQWGPGTFACACMCMCMCMYVYMCIYVYMYVCICIYMFMCMYVSV